MASSLTPNLRIRRATPEDIPSLVRVHFDAFGTGPNAVMHRLMYPDGANETIKTRFGKSFFPEDGASLPPFETLTMVAEVDNEQGQTEIAAFSKWKIVREPLPEEVWNKQESFTAGELGEGTNAAVYEEFLGGLHRLRRKWMKGDPCLHLGILAVTTARQRLGAGSALLTWGTELADREGLMTWLEASPAGYPLYRKFGFEDVEVQDLRVTELWGAAERGEFEDWGQRSAVGLAGELPLGTFRTVVVKRPPRSR